MTRLGIKPATSRSQSGHSTTEPLCRCFLWRNKKDISIYLMKKAAYLLLCSKHAQNVWIHIILHMRKISSSHLLSTETFYGIQSFCLLTTKALIRQHRCAGRSGPSLSAYIRRHHFSQIIPTIRLVPAQITSLEPFGNQQPHLTFSLYKNKT